MAYQISKKRKFVQDGVFRAELDEFLTRELAEDGYSGVEVSLMGSIAILRQHTLTVTLMLNLTLTLTVFQASAVPTTNHAGATLLHMTVAE